MVFKVFEEIMKTNSDKKLSPVQEKIIEEFREKFTFGGITGIVALKTDNAFEIEKFILNWTNQVAEEARRQTIQSMYNFLYDCEKYDKPEYNHMIDEVASKLKEVFIETDQKKNKEG